MGWCFGGGKSTDLIGRNVDFQQVGLFRGIPELKINIWTNQISRSVLPPGRF
jgi:hypothetical protein